ncbi:hypothetical protein GCM10022234_35920 [Aeromicrobium panaciterrae]|uniref:hypothetical protein n=1 Tax=Aeromicrobium panaciterrae TaxID=363861 RepID=UPI0031DFA4A3
MVVVDDRLGLSWWNGRPTVMIEVIDGRPRLAWLIVGHNEPFDVWLFSYLTWDEADALTAMRPAGLDLDAWLGEREGEFEGWYSLYAGGGLLAQMTVRYPNRRGLAREAMRVMHEAVVALLDDKPELRPIADDLAYRLAA